ncbi:ATP-binding protein [Nocardioides mesophilus]|uniref:ATP-binding protein n=1 Tax=Nocardioides mesophilus TaxID=433659 RepID=A0A7G9RH95_9ACTN|nr:ATP-binding protein [Nocardioides mesophilus]
MTVSIARDPALVRTVRLVAAAVARRASQDEEFVEEVRLAVGEACALMVGNDPKAATGLDTPVTITLSLDDRLRVDVESDAVVARDDSGSGDVDGVEPWALLRGLIDDLELTEDGAHTMLSMSWSLS